MSGGGPTGQVMIPAFLECGLLPGWWAAYLIAIVLFDLDHGARNYNGCLHIVGE